MNNITHSIASAKMKTTQYHLYIQNKAMIKNLKKINSYMIPHNTSKSLDKNLHCKIQQHINVFANYSLEILLQTQSQGKRIYCNKLETD